MSYIVFIYTELPKEESMNTILKYRKEKKAFFWYRILPPLKLILNYL